MYRLYVTIIFKDQNVSFVLDCTPAASHAKLELSLIYLTINDIMQLHIKLSFHQEKILNILSLHPPLYLN